jgi:hypothetical protein
VGVSVGEGALVWLMFSISYILLSAYYYIVYGVICFGKTAL